jgi:hypothetical protein
MKGETMKEQPDSELYAELAALRQRLSHLEAEQEKGRRHTAYVQRPTFLRKCLLGPLPLALLVMGGGLLYAQGDALFIDAKGNVGIGDLTPQGFQVVLPEKNKPANPKAGITLAGGLDGNASIEVRNNGTGTPYIDFAQKIDSDYDARLRLIAPGKLAIEGADLSTGGNVGIGTTTPLAKLDVAGTTRLGNGIAESWFPYTDKNAYISGQQTIFRNDASTEFARIDAKGNVGIGAKTPLAKLDVAGTVRLGAGIAESWFPYTDKNAYISGQQTIFRNDASTEFARIDAKGNVGIGTKTPLAKLDVEGVGRFTSLKLSNNWVINATSDALRFVNVNSSGNENLRMQLNAGERPQFNIPGLGIFFLGFNKLIGNDNNAQWQSDVRLKTEIASISSPLEKLNKIGGVMYKWNELGLQQLTREIETTISAGPDATVDENQTVWQRERDRRYKELSKLNVGVIAQDVEAVLPEAVTTDEDGYKSVRYYNLIPLLIEAIKEQDKTIQDQVQRSVRQQTEIERLAEVQQTVRLQSAELAAVKSQVVRLGARAQPGTAAPASLAPEGVPDASIAAAQ